MSDHRFTDINDDPSDLDPPTQAELDALARILGDDVVWDEPDPSVEDRVIAAIAGEAAEARRPGPAVSPTPLPSAGAGPAAADRPAPGGAADESPTGTVVDARHRFRRGGLVLGAAAAVVVVVAIGWAVLRSSEPDTGADVQVALAPTDLAPTDASGRADISARPAGTQIILDVRGLPPAPEGFYYEAWLRKSPEVGVSAGTFHLRGGGAVVELWSGVSTDDYPLVTVTIQEEGAGAESSGQVVLRGQVEGG